MAMVILFGAGDGGGLLITVNGVRRIPPFDPSLRRRLRAVADLANSLPAGSDDPDANELRQLANKLANMTVGEVEGVVGELDPENGLIYLDDDGGFTCGSTGRPPVPIPGRPHRVPSLDELISGGLVDPGILRLVEAAGSRGIDMTTMLEDPREVAALAGVEISEQAADDLRRLAPSSAGRFTDPVDSEIVGYFHKVLDHPEHLSEWATKPDEVTRAVGVELSAAARDRLEAVNSRARIGPGAVENPVAVAVAVGIVIMLVDRPVEIEQLAIRDRSLRQKL